MNNQHHLNRAHEANATGHSVAPGSYDRKSLNPAYAEHMYGEPGSAIPGHAASGVNPKRHIPRTLPNESGSVPSDISHSTTHPDSRLSGSSTTTPSHYTHGDAIPGSHASGVSSSSDGHGNATQIAPGSNVRHTAAPGTAGVAGSAMATAPHALGHNNAHPQFWKADDVQIGENAQTHAGSSAPGTLGGAAAHPGAQYDHSSAFGRKPVAQTGVANNATSAYDSAGVSPSDNLYRNDTVSAPSENSGHSGAFGSGVSGSSGHSFSHHNHGMQHSVADSTVPGSGSNAVHPAQGTHAPAVKYHGTVADRPVELDDPSSPVHNVANHGHNGALGQGDTAHPNLQHQTTGANHPGYQAGSYGPEAASHAHAQDNIAHPNTNTSNIQDTTHSTHGGLNEVGRVHHDHANDHTVGTGNFATTGIPTGDNAGTDTAQTSAHNGAPTHDPTANKVPSAAAGARFGEKLKGFAAQGHGLGEFLRGNANAAIDTALGDKKNMSKHEAIARKGEEEIKRGELANKSKTGIRH